MFLFPKQPPGCYCPLQQYTPSCTPFTSCDRWRAADLIDAGGDIGIVRLACFEVYDRRAEAYELMEATCYDDPRGDV